MTGSTPLRPPRVAVWELTWRCDLRCPHCLVSAGAGGGDELSTDEALGVVDQLAELGVRTVTLTGGEPLLRGDWAGIAARVRERGLVFRLSTNGHRVDEAVLERLLELETEAVIVSIDGVAATHDRLRLADRVGHRPGSYERVAGLLERLRTTSIRASVITSVGRRNLDELPAIHGLLKGLGVQTWQVQLAHRTGRAGQEGAPELLEPDELPRLVELLTPMTADPVLQPRIHNSIGYLSVEEPLLRPSGFRRGPRFWPGCRCGVISIGIEPDGGVKGCASQVGAPFVVGRLREEPLRTIWQERERWHWLKPSSLQGECADCALGKVCRAGCTALALSSSGRLFDNPHCLRAVRRRGMEEGP